MKKLWFGVKAIIIQNNTFLALKRTQEELDKWEIPGGRMEYGETIEETLHREIFEETNLKVSPCKILNTWDLIESHRQISGIIYLCKYESGEIKLSDEHREYCWLRDNEKQRLYNVFNENLVDIKLCDKLFEN